MRQQNDKTFAEMLNAIRERLPKAELVPDHDLMLKSRLGLEVPSGALHIFPLRRSAEEHNTHMLGTLDAKKHVVLAVDILDDRSGNKRKRLTPVPVDSNLSAELTLCDGCRVMMTSNLNVDDGLVNGVMV